MVSNNWLSSSKSAYFGILTTFYHIIIYLIDIFSHLNAKRMKKLEKEYLSKRTKEQEEAIELRVGLHLEDKLTLGKNSSLTLNFVFEFSYQPYFLLDSGIIAPHPSDPLHQLIHYSSISSSLITCFFFSFLLSFHPSAFFLK